MSQELKPSPPLGIYLHFPYCAQRCPYCDFTLTTKAFSHERYADAVLKELELRLGASPQPAPALTSLYLGGGTPGLWSPEQLKRVISEIGSRLSWREGAELTIEANPSELTLELAQAWREAGLNRISLGTQSFRAERLKWLGRTHSPDQARQAVGWARAAGFDNLNLDLMHGFVGQSPDEALADLEATLALDPEHISLYQLTVEPQTSFGARARRGEQLLAPEERLVELYEALARRLEEVGRPLYEISNAAKPGRESRHNRLYWTMGQYLGLGAGAHGMTWGAGPSGEASGWRWSNIKQPERYIAALEGDSLNQGAWEEEREPLDQVALYEEQILVGFRLSEGFEVSRGLRDFVGERADEQLRAGLLIDEGGRWRASPQGRLLLNQLIMKLLT